MAISLGTCRQHRWGSITFRSRFLDFTGRLVLHCRMMNHEAVGMTQVVEIVAEG